MHAKVRAQPWMVLLKTFVCTHVCRVQRLMCLPQSQPISGFQEGALTEPEARGLAKLVAHQQEVAFRK